MNALLHRPGAPMVIVQHSRDEEAATIELVGAIDADGATDLFERLEGMGEDSAVRHVTVDFSRVERIESAAVVAVTTGARDLRRAGKTCELCHLSQAMRAAFDLLPDPPEVLPPPPKHTPIGAAVRGLATRTGRTLIALADLYVETVRSAGPWLIGRGRFPLGTVVEQIVSIGADALVIVAPLSVLIGIVLGFESLRELERFGTQIFMADIVGLGMVREFGPFMTAIIVAGRSGSAMAAELATMAVNDELDALKSMSIRPARFLVVPRILAITLVEPILTLMSMALGIGGGLLTALILHIPTVTVFSRMTESVTLSDFGFGLTKSVLFAWIVGFTGCLIGLRTRGGAHNVGLSTTRAVVVSIFAIVTTDALMTMMWTMRQNV